MHVDPVTAISLRLSLRASLAGLLALVVLPAAGTAQVADTTTIRGRLGGIELTTRQGASEVVLRTGHNTPAGQALLRALRSEHVVMDGMGRAVDLPRGGVFPMSVVVITPRLTLGARVRGDVVVIGGDLFLHPGARVEGDAIAIGGGVYLSSLAALNGERVAFRDETFDAAREGERIALTHRTTRVDAGEPVLTWPFRIGIRTPSYSRVDGVVLPWGPSISLGGGRLTADPVITYRSDLGTLDPSLRAIATFGALSLTADARRGTFSNDGWIRNDLLNSLTTLYAGRDTRNYFRADRLELRLGTRWTPGAFIIEPYLGARNELAWSTAGELSRESHPWSLFGKDSIYGIFRPNPPVLRGRTESALAGGRLRWAGGGVVTRLTVDVERAWEAPSPVPTMMDPLEATPRPGELPAFRGGEFTQATFHGTIAFPTFGTQRYEARARAVTSTKRLRSPPPQRYAYLGGGGTIPTMRLLEEGGTELFFVASDYIIPIPAIELPVVGSPTLTLLHRAGSAGVDSLPRLTQNIGARVGARFVGVQYLIDPSSRRSRFGVGFSLGF